MSQCLDENSALELLDGRLAGSERARVEQHLESCDACRELVAELAKVEGEESGGAIDTERTPISDTSSGLTHAGPYRIEREVGSGASGTVYRAIDDRTKQVVALKYVTEPAWCARFRREVETLARLVHPGIVRYIAHGETPHGLYLAMEWLDGEDLDQRLRRGPLSWHAARVLALRITAALAHAHALGAVHRDLGPRNIFLPGGRVEDAKVLDFGLVRVTDGLERTASQAVLGTPFYMSPEQVKDPRNVDARADLFALGVVLFEAVSGARPFQGEDLFTVWVKIVDHPAPDLRRLTRGVPEAFVLVIEALLAKEPMARPGSAAEVHQRLLQLEGLANAALPLAPAPHAPGAPLPAPPYPPPAAETFGSRSGGPHVFVDSRSAPLTSRTANASPSRRSSGVFIAAGVGVTALVAASTLAVVGPKVLRRGLAGESRESRESSGIDAAPAAAADVVPLGDDEDVPARTAEPNPPSGPVPTAPRPRGATPVADAGVPSKGPPPQPSETLFCGGDNVERRRGGNYQPAPDFPQREPVIVGASCKATLEDCIIGGARSVSLLGEAELTLRRCRVHGEVSLVGSPTLILEGTSLPKPPKIVGKGRILRR